DLPLSFDSPGRPDETLAPSAPGDVEGLGSPMPIIVALRTTGAGRGAGEPTFGSERGADGAGPPDDGEPDTGLAAGMFREEIGAGAGAMPMAVAASDFFAGCTGGAPPDLGGDPARAGAPVPRGTVVERLAGPAAGGGAGVSFDCDGGGG